MNDGREVVRRLFLAKVSDARLEIFLASFGDFLSGARLLGFEILDARVAVTAFHGCDMKFDVVGGPLRQHAQQIASELLASRATEPVTPPDFAQ